MWRLSFLVWCSYVVLLGFYPVLAKEICFAIDIAQS